MDFTKKTCLREGKPGMDGLRKRGGLGMLQREDVMVRVNYLDIVGGVSLAG